MALPIRTILDDIEAVCGYLATKPTGATLAEARTVIDAKQLDSRKLSALKYWGLITQDEDGRIKATAEGRELTRGESWRERVLAGVVTNIPAYRAVIERAIHRKEYELTSNEVAAHWHEHFRSDVGSTDKIINDQAICFFHLAEGAGLGKLTRGRRGGATRFTVHPEKATAWLGGRGGAAPRTPTAKPQPQIRLEPRAPTPTSASQPISDSPYLQRGLQVDCYRLSERLGSGFSAEVWSAVVERIPPGVDLSQDQEVAIKFYTTNALAIPDQVIRVEREYRVAQRLRHPHLIRIYEFVLASPRPHHNFLVMDVAPGPTLAELLKTQKFDPDVALRIIAQILSGVEALHSAGALHRDIKPGNIAVSREPESDEINCVLLDLGIVSPMFEKGVTAVSRFVGSKHWAPLEQLLGQALDPRSDLYSVGAVAYNMLVGVEPYTSSATEAAVAVEMSRNALAIPSLQSVPAEITDMLNSCLAINPASRPGNARECLELLRRHGIEP